MKKIIIRILILGIIGAGFAYWYIFFGPASKHPDAAKQKSELTLSADSLFSFYENNTELADSLYNGKVIEVNGVINHIEQDNSYFTIYLKTKTPESYISCEMDTSINSQIKQMASSENITIKGFCNGMLSDVSLDRCKLAR